MPEGGFDGDGGESVKRRVFIVWPCRGPWNVLRYLEKALSMILEELGFDPHSVSVDTMPEVVNEGDVVISPRPVPRREGAVMVFYCMDPIGKRIQGIWTLRYMVRGKGFTQRVLRECQSRRRWFDAVFCYDEPIMRFFARWDIPTYLVPIGYHESFEVEGTPQEEGVFFLGTPSERRDALVAACGGTHIPGGQRSDYLNTPGVHLVFNRGYRAFDSIRIVSLLLSNRRCVLTDLEAEWMPLISGEHFYSASTRYLPYVCEDLMKNPGIRRKIARLGYEFIKKHFRFDDHVGEAMKGLGVSA